MSWGKVEEILDTFLKSTERPNKPKRKFSASSAGMCQRNVLLSKLGGLRTPLTPQQRRVFWIGTILHEALIKVLKLSGLVVAYETYVGDRDDKVVGSFDFILRDEEGEVYTLYDLKNISESSFWSVIKRLFKQKLGPPKTHVYQLVTYWILNKKYRVDSIQMAYMSKENGNWKEWEINITDKLINEVKSWWDDTHSYLDKKVLPPIQPTEELQKEYYCNSCSFRDYYCFPSEEKKITQEDLDKNISALNWSVDFEELAKEKKEEIKLEDGPKEPHQVSSTELHVLPSTNGNAGTRTE